MGASPWRVTMSLGQRLAHSEWALQGFKIHSCLWLIFQLCRCIYKFPIKRVIFDHLKADFWYQIGL